jgi:DNA-binding CsgD family transcriptional regulator/KaiC/GvpD/RAD55 family RecA-like ATPase
MESGERPVIGRVEELRGIASALFGDGPPNVVLVDGEPGIGKTAVWESVVAEAARRGRRVVVSRPASSETVLTYTGLGDLLDGVFDEIAPALPLPQRRALSVALLREEPRGAGLDRRAVAAAFLSALRVLGRDRQVLVAVDDLQWLDAPSADVIGYAARRLEGEPVALLLARRTDPAGPDSLDRDRLTVVELGPLGLSDVHRLVVDRLGVALPRPLLRRVYEASGGNPFFALELARALERTGARPEESEPLPLPGSLRDLVGERLAELPARTRDALCVAALAAQPSVALVSDVLGEDAWETLRPAAAGGVITFDQDRIRFAHPLLVSVVEAAADLRQRRRVHGLLASAVSDSEEAAWHRALATESPDENVAAVVEKAAERAVARGAPQTGAALLEQVIRLTPPGDTDSLCGRFVAAARACVAAGDSRRARELFERAFESATTGSRRASVLTELALLEVGIVGAKPAVETFERALAEAGDDVRLQASIHAEIAQIVRFTRGMEAADRHAQLAVSLAEQTRDPALLRRALTAHALLRFNTGQGLTRELLARASALAPDGLDESFGPDLALAHQLLWSGELQEARKLLERIRADFSDDDVALNKPLWYLSLVRFRLGDWREAERLAEASHELVVQAGRESDESSTLFPLALLAAHRGSLPEARALAERGVALAEAAGSLPFVFMNRAVLGFAELSRGDAAAALAQLLPAERLRVEVGLHEPGMAMVVVAETVEALVLEGRLGEAAETLEPWAERAQALDRQEALAAAWRCRAQLAAASGDVDGALDASESALAACESGVDPFSRARTLLVAGAIRRRARQKGRAREALESARESFERLGAELWAAKAKDELARIDGRGPAGGELTKTEQRVAALVAEGRSTKQAAATLFCSPKTVEGHLSRIYKKLDVHSRTELAQRLRTP